jgi:hypothetical protein
VLPRKINGASVESSAFAISIFENTAASNVAPPSFRKSLLESITGILMPYPA